MCEMKSLCSVIVLMIVRFVMIVWVVVLRVGWLCVIYSVKSLVVMLNRLVWSGVVEWGGWFGVVMMLLSVEFMIGFL